MKPKTGRPAGYRKLALSIRKAAHSLPNGLQTRPDLIFEKCVLASDTLEEAQLVDMLLRQAWRDATQWSDRVIHKTTGG